MAHRLGLAAVDMNIVAPGHDLFADESGELGVGGELAVWCKEPQIEKEVMA